MEFYDGTLIWNYEVIPAPSAVCVKAKTTLPTTASIIDQKLPLLNLQAHISCNCSTSSPNQCLVHFESYREETDEPELEEEEGSEEEAASPSEDQYPSEEQEDDEDNDELYVHCFKIVGSHWENRYQEALSNCHELKSQNHELRLRAISEPDNIKDSNAIKFEVL